MRKRQTRCHRVNNSKLEHKQERKKHHKHTNTNNEQTQTHNKQRSRESTSPVDLFYAHISGMDALARGLRSAAALLEAGDLTALREERYASWKAKGGIGQKIQSGKVGFADLEKFALSNPDPGFDVGSGRQELAEIYLNMHV